ncbi:hypothetical protein [Roseobacter sp. CCS2]|uniref:hypothetical protein n=1 Tax=Roseobacter sp. CCS2 TaxID=391593 RepID=UPI0000F4024F|nr:hypothetical protein [Roseobacter sp. CCS2]EBA13799.1 hypothetical protein RCCS2_07919 [Roseobacter sp. CCS2]
MALRYDFDMVALTPDGLPDQFGDLEATGVATEKVAMFRDPDTVTALKAADTAVRTYFIDSGFALKQFDSGAPAGHFAMRDEDARIAVINRLTANLETHDLANAAWGGFDFDAFMDAMATAEPVEDTLLAPPKKRPVFDQDLATARIASQKKKGRRMMALGGLMLGLILLFYVASQSLM